MKSEKKSRVLSIRAKMVLYLTIFTAVSLTMLMLFQVLFLDDLYKQKLIASVKSASDDVAESIDDAELDRYLEYWNVKEQFSVYIVDSNGTVLQSNVTADKIDTAVFPQSLDSIYRYTLNEGEYLETYQVSLYKVNHDTSKGHLFGGKSPFGVPEKPSKNLSPEKPKDGEVSFQGETDEMVVYARMAGEKMVMLTAHLSPVDAAIDTLYIQFLIAAVVLIGFAVMTGWVLAGKIARPIDKINEASKKLADGNYRSPDVSGYKEAVELCQTLDNVSIELQKTEQLQRDLIANVSHDLRTPLTMITGYSEAIRDLPGENSAENIQVVIDEAQRLTELVNDVLDLSKLQSGTQSVTLEPLDLTEIVASVVSRCETMIANDGYHIVYEGGDAAMIKGDAVRLAQIIYNLLGNALAYTGKDQTVRVAVTKQNGYVRVSVSDSGKGISEEEIRSIWQRYYQSPSTTHRRQIIGTGLGLSIVYNLVTLHNGQCGVESEIGKGSTFWFDIPLLP